MEKFITKGPLTDYFSARSPIADLGSVKQRADVLGLSPEAFWKLLGSANKANDIFIELGPFYGKDKKGEAPTFRITAEPLYLPKTYERELQILGGDVLSYARALARLPQDYRQVLGPDVSFVIPQTWRLDLIFDETERLQVNEVQVNDGADGLMVAEQIAYGLRPLSDSTAYYLAEAYKNRFKKADNTTRIAWVRQSEFSSYTPNARRMSEFINLVSSGTVTTDFIYKSDLPAANWDQYDGVVNTSYTSPTELAAVGLDESKLVNPGSYAALENKGAFALLSDELLRNFWINQLGSETFERLQYFFIPTAFVSTDEMIDSAQRQNGVIKAFEADGYMDILDSGKGVFGPWCDFAQWQQCYMMFDRGVRFIAQPFVTPKQFTAFMRTRGGKNLERMDGLYNRICAKFVATGDPHELTTDVLLTAVEATLGKGRKPVGKDCCFTAVAFG
ncbi:MAG: hypothetical protein HY428_02515 [Candidatus Levybacteria bacterium]|nr:hypothetical protein [Candidatus Levybacteria bacterium]